MKHTTAALVLSLATAVDVRAQPSAAADPIRCWWRTTTAAVAIGEPFDATLTCAAREHDAVRAVPDESRLAAAVIQLAPFEVLGGSHPDDLRTATHRFLQYHYTLRVIDRDVIGRDTRVPDLQIAYRVHTKVNGEWAQGRDRTYVMPGQSVRVLSLVPADADDIRDSADEDFRLVSALRFRSRALQITAIAMLAIGIVIAVPAVVGLVRRGALLTDTGENRVSRRVLLAAASKELSAIADERRRGGWTTDLAARTLSVVRLIAAGALNREIAQRSNDANLTADGRVVVPVGLRRRESVVVSSTVTSLDLRRALAALPLTAPHEQRQTYDNLLQLMTALTRALYTGRFNPEDATLDQSLEAAAMTVQRVRARR